MGLQEIVSKLRTNAEYLPSDKDLEGLSDLDNSIVAKEIVRKGAHLAVQRTLSGEGGDPADIDALAAYPDIQDKVAKIISNSFEPNQSGRFTVKNLGGSPQEMIGYLKSINPEFDYKFEKGELQVIDPDTGYSAPIDPTGFSNVKEFIKDVGDSALDLVNMAGTAAIGGPVLSGAAKAAGLAGVSNAIQQVVRKVVYPKASFNPAEFALETGGNAAGVLAFGTRAPFEKGIEATLPMAERLAQARAADEASYATKGGIGRIWDLGKEQIGGRVSGLGVENMKQLNKYPRETAQILSTPTKEVIGSSIDAFKQLGKARRGEGKELQLAIEDFHQNLLDKGMDPQVLDIGSAVGIIDNRINDLNKVPSPERTDAWVSRVKGLEELKQKFLTPVEGSGSPLLKATAIGGHNIQVSTQGAVNKFSPTAVPGEVSEKEALLKEVRNKIANQIKDLSPEIKARYGGYETLSDIQKRLGKYLREAPREETKLKTISGLGEGEVGKDLTKEAAQYGVDLSEPFRLARVKQQLASADLTPSGWGNKMVGAALAGGPTAYNLIQNTVGTNRTSDYKSPLFEYGPLQAAGAFMASPKALRGAALSRMVRGGSEVGKGAAKAAWQQILDKALLEKYLKDQGE